MDDFWDIVVGVNVLITLITRKSQSILELGTVDSDRFWKDGPAVVLAFRIMWPRRIGRTWKILNGLDAFQQNLICVLVLIQV